MTHLGGAGTTRQSDYAYARLGEACVAAGDIDSAIQYFRLALRQNPADVLVLSQLGTLLHQQIRPREALVAFRSALALKPGLLAARLGMGALLCAIDDYDAAIPHLEAAIRLDAGRVQAWYNLGCAKLGQGDYEAAEAAFTQTLRLQPDWSIARVNRALTWLSAGDFTRGLPEYEWRFSTIVDPNLKALPPRWDGRPLHDKTLLIYAEQGLGDTLNFLRFLPAVLPHAPKVACRIQSALFPLLEPLLSAWGVEALDARAPLRHFDFSCPLMSLPLTLGLSLAMPVASPVVQAPTEYRDKWRDKITQLGKRRIGIAWSGNRRPYDARAMAASSLEPLFSVPSVEWVVLQTELSEEDRQYLQATSSAARIHCPTNQIADMADTAAIIEQLEAVISIDTSIAHLAGVMHKPVWVMVPFAADWRWRIDGETSRWYPSARLIRQDRPGDWEALISQIAQELVTGSFFDA